MSNDSTPSISVVRLASPSSLYLSSNNNNNNNNNGDDELVTHLQQLLIRHFKNKYNYTTSNNSNNDNCIIDQKNELFIENKYFEATIQLSPLSTLSSSSLSNSNVTQFEDGIILLFPTEMKPNLSSLHHHATSINQAGDLLRLCIAILTPSDTTTTATKQDNKEYEETYSSRVLWCLDHGYEYIEADLSEYGIQHSNFEQREKDGFARIVEAIESTVWTGALKKKKSIITQEGTKQMSSIGSSGGKNDCVVNDKDDSKKVYPIHHVDEKCTTNDDISTTINTSNTNHDIPNEPILFTTNPNDHNDDEEEENHDLDTTNNNQNTNLINNFEQCIKEASRIRQASKNQDMSDDDRRKRAADAANMLMSLMNQMGDFDEEESEGDDDDNSL